MLLTSLLPESAVKKPATLAGDFRSPCSIKPDSQHNGGLQSQPVLLARRNSEKPVKKQSLLFRRFSFQQQSKKDEDDDMVSSTEIIGRSTFRGSTALRNILNAGKKKSCNSGDDLITGEMKNLATCLEAEMDNKSLTGQQMSDTIQKIYKTLDTSLQNAVRNGDISDEVADERLNSFQKKLMRNLHCKLFNRILEEGKIADQSFKEKICSLHWVTPQHLDTKLNENDREVTELLDKAMLDIAAINFKESPSEKLECIMNCSRKVFALLKMHHNTSESADDFLPVLVYIVLLVNPMHLHSNIKYIMLFSSSDTVLKGEEGYYFTHLCSVASFIENITGQSLNMSEEEFQRHMSGSANNDLEEMLMNRSLANSICKVYNETAEAEALKSKTFLLKEKLFKVDIVIQTGSSEILTADASKYMTNRLETTCRRKYKFFPFLQCELATEVCEDVFFDTASPMISGIDDLKLQFKDTQADDSDDEFVDITSAMIDEVGDWELQTKYTETVSNDEFIDIKSPMISEIRLQTVNAGEINCSSDQEESVNGCHNRAVSETKFVELKTQKKKKSEQICISTPKNTSDSVDVIFDVKSYLLANEPKNTVFYV